MPEVRIGTKQQETGTLKRESHLFQNQVQHPGHASRPQQGPMNHTDDSAYRQETSTVFSRYSTLHGALHSKPLTSHRAASGNA